MSFHQPILSVPVVTTLHKQSVFMASLHSVQPTLTPYKQQFNSYSPTYNPVMAPHCLLGKVCFSGSSRDCSNLPLTDPLHES